MSEPPAKPGEAPPSLNARIARLRAATGRPEILLLSMKCSRSLRGFQVEFGRLDPDKKFEIARIIKDGEAQDGARESSVQDSGRTFPASLISLEKFACPWCTARRLVNHPACATMWCSGATEKTETGDRFACPHCHISFSLAPKGEFRGLRDAGASVGAKLLGAASAFLKLGQPQR